MCSDHYLLMVYSQNPKRPKQGIGFKNSTQISTFKQT
jgi:hypothetical protein